MEYVALLMTGSRSNAKQTRSIGLGEPLVVGIGDGDARIGELRDSGGAEGARRESMREQPSRLLCGRGEDHLGIERLALYVLVQVMMIAIMIMLMIMIMIVIILVIKTYHGNTSNSNTSTTTTTTNNNNNNYYYNDNNNNNHDNNDDAISINDDNDN